MYIIVQHDRAKATVCRPGLFGHVTFQQRHIHDVSTPIKLDKYKLKFSYGLNRI